MALQTKTLVADGAKGHHRFTLTITEDSIDSSKNISKISFKLMLSPIVANYDWLYTNTVPVTYSININGTIYSGNIMAYDGVSTVKVYGVENLAITHNTDGAKTINYSFSVSDIGKSFMPGACSASGTMALTNIPRGATLVSVPQFYDDVNPVINYTNPAGNAVASLEIGVVGDSGVMAIAYKPITNKTGNSYTFIFTEAERQVLYNTFLYKVRYTGLTFRLKTVIGSNTFYSDFTTSVEMRNASPVISNINLRDTRADTVELTGNDEIIIKGYNSVIGTITAEAQKGATIQNYKTTNGNITKWANSNLFENTESATFNFTVIDDRGFYTEESRTLTIIDYYKPTCTLKTSAEIVEETTARITLEVSGLFFNSSFGAKDNNMSVWYSYKINNGDYGNWVKFESPIISNGKYTATATVDGNYLDTFTFKAVVYDALNLGGIGSSIVPVRIVPTFDWSETDFNFNVPVNIKGIELDYIIEQGTNNGWQYRKWNSGKAECWKILTLNTDTNTQWGGLWKGTYTQRQNYPFGFIEKPVETVTLQSGSYGAFVLPADNGEGVNGAYGTARYTVCRPAATNSAEYYLNFYIYGKWR